MTALVDAERLDAHTPVSPRSAQEISAALAELADRYRDYHGSETAETHSFLDRLFHAYGVDRFHAGVRYEDAQQRPDGSVGFVDAIWPGRVLIEMKRPSEAPRLAQHHAQAFAYWRQAADPTTQVEAPRYTVLCAFHRFLVYEFGRYPEHPLIDLTLDELPERQGALRFLAGQQPSLVAPDRKLTAEAAEQVVALYHDLVDRDAADADELQRFILQTVWCLFASDLGILEGHPVREVTQDLLADQAGRRSSAAELGHLYRLLNTPDRLHPEQPTRTHERQGGLFAGNTRYVNGGLFAEPAAVHLERDELQRLADIGAYRWRDVEPTIFGSLIEGFLERDRVIDDPGARSRFGVHFTHADDIRKLVVPTIVEPWTAAIKEASTVDEAVDVLDRLTRFRVLDPACGSGNFLYIAYQEIRELERAARDRIEELAGAAGKTIPDTSNLQYPLRNLHGIEIDPFAVRVAQVVLWMGHELAGRRLDTPEPLLPLPDLSQQILQADALGIDWPPADAIIGNPPYIGSQRMRRALGAEALNEIENRFGCGIRDYCVYWFRKAADHLPAGGRAGLVATNSIAQESARRVSLDYVVDRGGVLVDVVPTQQWQGDANVHVALINWVHQPPPDQQPTEFRIDHTPIERGIGADLRPAAVSVVTAVELAANDGIAFQGPNPVGKGFILDEDEALTLLRRTDADYSQVVRPYLDADDISGSRTQEPSRWIIDFGTMELENARQYPAALAIVRERVKPERENNAQASRRERWWRFGAAGSSLRRAVAPLHRYIAVGRHGKRTLFVWCNSHWLASDATVTVALDGDYHFGVLSSNIHVLWAGYRGSTIKDDPRYTHTTVFRSFPWPDPDPGTRERIEAAARNLLAERRTACQHAAAGLTDVYNLVDEGGYQKLARAHQELDQAVAAAYGWPEKISNNAYEVIPQLMELNRRIANGEIDYAPFADHPTRQTTSTDEQLF